ncbi:hypothetical protein DH2020_023097 [Rehmannia glutinosa]|uniref:Uncharacterized protein n=1 Tax=Rehmannia glutinosa TaxID=99300 RepID=A0ABR0W6V1_REHGL
MCEFVPIRQSVFASFPFGWARVFLSAHCNMDQQSSFHCFGLFLGMQEKGSVTFAVDYEFAARSKPLEEYISKYKGNYIFTGGKAVGYRNLFSIPWTSFMAATVFTSSMAYFILEPSLPSNGGKNRKRGKNEADDEKRELVFKEDGQEYAQVLRMLQTQMRGHVSMALSVCAISEARCTRRFGSPPVILYSSASATIK